MKQDPSEGQGTPKVDLDAVMQNMTVKSLDGVAKAFGVTLGTVRKWKASSPELRGKRPYNIGKCALELVANKVLDISSVSTDIQVAMTLDAGLTALKHNLFDRMLDRVGGDEAVQLIKRGEIERMVDVYRTRANPVPPVPQSASVVVAIARPKTAALFVDRVWSISPEVPHQIAIDCETGEEGIFRGLIPSLALTLGDLHGLSGAQPVQHGLSASSAST